MGQAGIGFFARIHFSHLLGSRLLAEKYCLRSGPLGVELLMFKVGCNPNSGGNLILARIKVRFPQFMATTEGYDPLTIKVKLESIKKLTRQDII